MAVTEKTMGRFAPGIKSLILVTRKADSVKILACWNALPIHLRKIGVMCGSSTFRFCYLLDEPRGSSKVQQLSESRSHVVASNFPHGTRFSRMFRKVDVTKYIRLLKEGARSNYKRHIRVICALLQYSEI